MSNAHTPGPWRPNGDNPEVRPEYREDRYITTSYFDEESGAGEIICVCRGHGPKMRANARLIAAGPKVVALLYRVIKDAEAGEFDDLAPGAFLADEHEPDGLATAIKAVLAEIEGQP